MHHPFPSLFGPADHLPPIRRRSRAESSSSWAAGLAGLCVVLFLSLLLPFPALAQAILGGQSIPSRPALPANSVGVDNSYYFDFTTGNVYGPKSLGQWPPGIIANFGPTTPPVSFISNPSIQSTMTADGGVVTIQNSGLTAGFLNAQYNPVFFNDGLRVTSWNDVGTHVGDVGGVSSYFLSTNPREYDPVTGRVTFQNNSVNFTGFMFCGAAGAWCWNFDYAITDQDQFHNHYPAFLLGEHDVNVFDTGTVANPSSILANFHVQPKGGVGIGIANLGTGPYGFLVGYDLGQGAVKPGGVGFDFGSEYKPTNAPYLSLANQTINANGTSGCIAGTYPIAGGTLSPNFSQPSTYTITVGGGVITSVVQLINSGYIVVPPNPVSLTGTGCSTQPSLNINWAQGSDSYSIALGFLTRNYAAYDPITIVNAGTSGCILGTYNIPGGTLATNYASPATVSIDTIDGAGAIATISVAGRSGYSTPPAGNLTILGTGCAVNPIISLPFLPANDNVQMWVSPTLGTNGIVYTRDTVTGGTTALTLGGSNIALNAGNALQPNVTFTIATQGVAPIALSPYSRLVNNYTVATLPACSAGNIGTFTVVTDANAPTLGGTLSGGGATTVLALCAGASGWKAS